MNIFLLVACVVMYLLGALLMTKYMDEWLASNPEEQHFFLSSKLDVIIIAFWFCFIVVAIVIDVFGPAEE